MSGPLLLATASLVALEYPLGRWGCKSINPLGGGGGELLIGLVISLVAAVLAIAATWLLRKWLSLALGPLVLAAALGVEWVGATDAGCYSNF